MAIQKLNSVGKNNKVSINWIKAHNDHALNNIADNLAKHGSASLAPHNLVPIPDAYIKELIDKETTRRWNSGWVNVDGHIQTKLFFPEVNVNKARKLYKATKSLYSQAYVGSPDSTVLLTRIIKLTHTISIAPCAKFVTNGRT